MKLPKLLFSTAAVCNLGSLCADEPTQSCSEATKSLRMDIRHLEPKGIGFDKGYTTLELFLMPHEKWMGFYPYLDLRGHVFNDRKFASNVGIGARFLCRDRIYGLNAYYDFRDMSHQNFNQASLGLETLGVRWDFSANGYLIAGHHRSDYFDRKFDRFKGHSLILKQKAEYALSGADAEAGYHFLKNQKWDVYLGAGPYYYHNHSVASLFGGKARLATKLWTYFTVEASASYDHIFKWIGQAQVGISIPLGKRFKVKPCKKTSPECCETALALRDRLVQIPDHNEIIVAKRHRSHTKAIDPATGNPYYFIFVNNTHPFSDGSFGDPFGSLAAASAASSPGNIIYVLEGDGTNNNMSSGIVLKNSQQFLGSGVSHTLPIPSGSATIPQMTSGLPVITNTGGDAVVLASNNTVSGFHIALSTKNGIFGSTSSSATITRNLITNVNQSNTDKDAGIHLVGAGLSGDFTISNNTITGNTTTQMQGIFVTLNDAANCNFYLSNNTITTKHDPVQFVTENTSHASLNVNNNVLTTTTAGHHFFVESKNTSTIVYNFESNLFSSSDLGVGLLIQGRHTSTTSGTISANTFAHNEHGLKIAPSPAHFTANVVGNIFSNNTITDFVSDIEAGHNGTMCLSLLNNNAPTFGYKLSNDVGTFNLSAFEDNVGALSTTGTITQNPGCP